MQCKYGYKYQTIDECSTNSKVGTGMLLTLQCISTNGSRTTITESTCLQDVRVIKHIIRRRITVSPNRIHAPTVTCRLQCQVDLQHMSLILWIYFQILNSGLTNQTRASIGDVITSTLYVCINWSSGNFALGVTEFKEKCFPHFGPTFYWKFQWAPKGKKGTFRVLNNITWITICRNPKTLLIHDIHVVNCCKNEQHWAMCGG